MGPPFVGKSYWAKKISKELNAECVDLDHVIEEFAAKEVSKIFEEGGETYFRKIESRCLRSLTESRVNRFYVLATGGGVVLSLENRKFLKEHSRILFLDTDFDNLPVNSKVEILGTSRPLFKKSKNLNDLKKQWTELRDERLTHYQELAPSITPLELEKKGATFFNGLRKF